MNPLHHPRFIHQCHLVFYITGNLGRKMIAATLSLLFQAMFLHFALLPESPMAPFPPFNLGRQLESFYAVRRPVSNQGGHSLGRCTRIEAQELPSRRVQP